jgi:hypothetical protein
MFEILSFLADVFGNRVPLFGSSWLMLGAVILAFAAISWLSDSETLSEPALTVRAQTVSPNDDGRLIWDTIYDRDDVDSVDLRDVTTLDYRPATDRREWNAIGRHVPLQTPSRRNVSIVPIEGYARIDEKEMQELVSRAMGNEAIFQDLISARLPDRVEMIALANYRRLELDCFQAWLTGTVTQRNPQDSSKTYAASFGFPSDRLETAGTPWSDVGVNAWNEFVAWLLNAQDAVGDLSGAMMRRATYNAIIADAPHPTTGPRLSRRALETLIEDELGTDFNFFINERTVGEFTDGGIVTAPVKVFTAQRVAAIPADGRIGRAAFAPVARAGDLAPVEDAGIDIRGNRVFHEASNNGKSLQSDVQLNAMPIPDEQRLKVINAGV